MNTRATPVLSQSWRALATATVLMLASMSAAGAATLTHNAWGSNYSVDCTGNAALQFNATRHPGDGAGSLTPGNTLVMLTDVTYWYPNYPCYESTTWTSTGTGRKAAKVSGADMNPNPTSAADFYLPTDRFIKLRNLTIDNVDLDYDNTALWFFTSGAVSPAPDMSLTLSNGSITGFNPPLFDSRANFRLSATGDSTISNWWAKVDVPSTTALNVTGAGSTLTFYRVGNVHGNYHDALYFYGAGNTATIDGSTLKLDQSSLTFGQSNATPGIYGQMTFQNGASLELVNESSKLKSGDVAFINSSLKLGLGATRLTVDARLTLDGASVDIADSAAKLTTPVLDVFGRNTIALPQEYSSTNYSVTAAMVVMEPDSTLTLNGQGSLASDFELRWTAASSDHYGQIIINDGASLVNNGGIFKVNPGARIAINRTNDIVFGSLSVKNGGGIELLGASSYFANFINQGEISAAADGAIAVSAGTYNILGGNQGVISIGEDGRLTVGNFGTAAGATAVLNTDNRVELNYFSTLQLTIDPTARSNSQLRSSSEVAILNFAELNLSLVNDEVLPVGTKFVLIDYAGLSGTGGVAGVANQYFNGHRDGSNFVLGLNRYQINYHDSGDSGYAGAVTLTVVPMAPPAASLSPSSQTLSGTVGTSINPSATMVTSGLSGAVTYSINPGLPAGLRFDLVTGVISGFPSEVFGPSSFTIRGVSDTGTESVTSTVVLQVLSGGQTISFGALPSPVFTPGGAFAVNATASSGLMVAFSSLTPSVCSVSGSLVTTLTAGTCTIAANQPGNATYGSATQVTQNITVSKGSPPPLLLTAASTQIAVGNGTALSATGGGTGAVTYSVTSGPCSLAGNTLTGTGVGSCTVTASQAADANFNGISSNPVTVAVGVAAQAPLLLSVYPTTISANGTSMLNTAGGTDTGLVTYAVISGPCTTNGATLTGVGVGRCQVVANKAGTISYSSVTSQPVTVVVNPGVAPALVLTSDKSKIGFGGSATLSVSGGISGGSVSYTVTGPCYVTGAVLTGIRAGHCLVVAAQAATDLLGAVQSNSVLVNVSERTTAFSYAQATATGGQGFSTAPVLAGFTRPTFAVLAGTLPTGLVLNPVTGAITGTPTGQPGTFSVVISVYENNAYDAAMVVITLQAPPASVVNIPTLSEWGMIVMAALMGGLAVVAQRRKGT